MPKVSVIIPTFNHASLVGATLESVFAQNLKDFEVIVVNDGSEDETAEVLRRHVDAGAIQYLEQPNRGVAAARNRGLAEANGDFIAFLDDDDLWPEDKLEWQLAAIETTEAVMVAGGHVSFQGFKTKVDEPRIERDAFRRLDSKAFFSGNPLASPGQALIRKSALERVGGFNPEIWGVDDLDLWLRLSAQGEVLKSERVALYYRVHSANASHNLSRMADNTERVLLSNLENYAGAERRLYAKAAYRFLMRYAGKKLLWKGAQLFKNGERDKGWAMMCRSFRLFKTRFATDPGLFCQYLVAILKVPLRMNRMR